MSTEVENQIELQQPEQKLIEDNAQKSLEPLEQEANEEQGERKEDGERKSEEDASRRSTFEIQIQGTAAPEEEEEYYEEDLPIEDIEHLTEEYFQVPRIYGVKDVVDPLTIESLYNIIYELGIIPLHWPSITDPHFETRTCLPESYYKNNDKERILLTFAENFRQQYIYKYPERRPLLLQAPNDCGLQKMVCTTIRPTWIRFPEMHGWEGCAKFVADYLDYEPLHKPVLLPERILSPYTVLKRQKGNCFEYATLLVSYLIGANIDAYVVFGYATREFTLGIFNRRTCPEQLIPPEPEPPKEIPVRKYKVNPGTDFRSQHLLRMEQKRKDKINQALEEDRIKKAERTKEIETPPPDDIYGWRVHAWVLVIPPQKQSAGDEASEKSTSAKSSQNELEETPEGVSENKRETIKEDVEKEGDDGEGDKEDGDRSGDDAEENADDQSNASDTNKKKEVHIVEDEPTEGGGGGEGEGQKDEEGEENSEEEEGEEDTKDIIDTPFYIEPVTGFRYDIEREEYLQIESIYNDRNYYVNLQDDRVPKTFNVRDKKSWLPFLPEIDNELAKKQFDMPKSWVEKLDLTNNEFTQRYPGGNKITRYKKVILEQYAPYSTMDGLLKRYKTFNDYSYTQPIYTHEWYDRRPDNLKEVHYDYVERIITEYFMKGREDYLKEHRYEMDRDESCVVCNRELFFYDEPRFDHLTKITTRHHSMTQDFINRDDKLYWRYVEFGDFFENEELHRNVMNVTEKFDRNSDIHASEDVAVKFFNVAISEIHLQYHYEENFVTKSTRVFYKPNLMDTGGILSYVPEMTAGYVANPNSPDPRQLKLYRQLVQYMKEEEEALHNVRAAEKILGDVIYLRAIERKLAADAVLLFDIDRNEEALKGITAKIEAERERKERELRGDYSPRSAAMALRDYINVVLSRQNTLQQRYDAIVTKLKEDRVWFLTNQYTIKPQEETEYVARRDQMNFEVSTIEIRMERQKILSKERFEHLHAIADARRSLSTTSSGRRVSQVDFEKKTSQSDTSRRSSGLESDGHKTALC